MPYSVRSSSGTLRCGADLSSPGAWRRRTAVGLLCGLVVAMLGVAVPTTASAAAGQATKLAFATQPSATSSSGVAFVTQPVVTVQDANGATVTSDISQVKLTLTGTGPAGAALVCSANPLKAVAGVASFSGCNVDKVGSGFTLTASSSNLTQTVSNSFTIIAGSATKLAFTTQPGSGTGGSAFATQPTVTVQDANSNTVTSDTSSVTLAISGATLTCATNPQTASAGVATFTGCSIDKSGTYTLTATDGTLTLASSTVQITVGAAAKLAFTTQPSATTLSGTAFAAQPVVAVQDAGGNQVSTDASSITLTLTGTGPSGAVLSCSATTKAAVAGAAAFTGCRVDKSGSGYTLTAADGNLTPATSSAFAITAGAAAKLAFVTQPGNGTGGIALPTQPVVTVQDANGNTVTGDASSVTLAITSSTGTAGSILTCTANPTSASSGAASFAGCRIDKAGTGYTLTATDGSLTAAVSAGLTVTVGPASQLALTTQPTPTEPAGASFPVVATEQDAGGNTLTTDSSTAVSLVKASGPGTLSCPMSPTTLTAGTGSFNCSITAAATGYALKATAGSFTTTSGPFTVVAAAASKLSFTTQPAGTTAGSTLANLAVSVQDVYGNLVTTGTGATDTLALSIGSGPGTLTAGSTASTNAAGGVATFSNVTLNVAGVYTLVAGDSTRSLTAATSNAFTIAAAPATTLAFVHGPSNAFAGSAMTPAITVQVQDSYGNASATTANVTLAPSAAGVIGSGGTATTNSNGLATFSPVFNSTGLALTLTASASGLTSSGASAPFNITVQVTSSANALNDTAADPNGANGSGVASVNYYYCSGLSGACTSSTGTLIAISTAAANNYLASWSTRPALGSYRVVVVAQDVAGNTSAESASTPVTITS